MSRRQRRAQLKMDIRTPLTKAGNLFNITDSDIALAQGCATLTVFFINLPEMVRQGTPEQFRYLYGRVEQDAAIINAYADATKALKGGETVSTDARIFRAMLAQVESVQNYFQIIQNDYPQVEGPFTKMAAEKGVTQAAVIELCAKLTAMSRAARPNAGVPA